MIYARIASVLTCIYAACFGVPAVPVSIWVAHNDTLPTFENFFPMYGGPWWSLFQSGTFTVVLFEFLTLTLVAASTAVPLWKGSKHAAAVNAAMLPVEAVFWYGFGLPIPWFIGLARATLIALAWRALK
jgi:hypothetical protein